MGFTGETVEAEGTAVSTKRPSKRHMTDGYSGSMCKQQ
jgi:hypothetical protein